MARTTTVIYVLLMTVLLSNVQSESSRFSLIKLAYSKLQNFVNSPGQPKGTPFPALKGKPLRSHRVAIVGAGIAGLHMAYLLKKHNFTNVVVLEKDSRVGGKVLSVHHKGVPHELGACYTTPDYITNVYELANELGINDFVPVPVSTVWLDGNISPLHFKTYIIADIMKVTGAKSPIEAVHNLIDASFRYCVLHRTMFGKYKGELMLKPSNNVLRQLNQTILSFLTKNNLLALAPVLAVSHTMQGYGQIDETSALYGLMWETPTFISAMLARALGVSMGGTEIFRRGFMQLTDKMASMLNVRLNTKIKNVERFYGGVKIVYESGIHDYFDFLIWAADAREALKVLDDTSSMEKSFSRLTNTWFTTALFDSTERCRSLTPVDYWLDNVGKKREHSVWARRHSNFAINGGICNFQAQNITKMSSVSYQMGVTPQSDVMVDAMFGQHFESCLGAKDVKIIKKKTWNYFPRFSVGDIADGMLWKIAEQQGKRNTWFIGGSVCFESTKSIIEYNRLMIERMKLL